MKKLSLYNLKRQLNNTLKYSWSYYLYLNKYPIICYFSYDGAETNFISALKLQLIKNENKLVIINKKQINYFYRKTPDNIFTFLTTGRYMMLLFNTWQELNICLNTELGLKLIQRYQFITISYDRQFLNLFWYKKPLNWIMNLYNNLNGNKLELVCLLCSSFFCLIYCLHYILTILLMVINKVTQLNNPRRND